MYIDKPTTRRTHAEQLKLRLHQKGESTLDRRVPGVRRRCGLQQRSEAPCLVLSPGPFPELSTELRGVTEILQRHEESEPRGKPRFFSLRAPSEVGRTQSGHGHAQYPGAQALGGSQRLNSVARCGSRVVTSCAPSKRGMGGEGLSQVLLYLLGPCVVWEPQNGPVYCKGARGLNRVGPQGTLDREHGQNQQFDLHGPTLEDQMENSSVNTWTCSPTPNLPLRNGRIPIQLRFSFHNLEK